MINKLNKVALKVIGRELTKQEKENAILLNSQFKTKHELLIVVAKIMSDAPNRIVQAMKAQRKINSNNALIAKLEKDPKQLALKNIRTEFENSTYPFNKRGYRAKFCKEMLEKHTQIEDIKSIENLFDRLKKEKYPLC